MNKIKTTQHTPGPWTFHRESSCDRGDSYGVRAPAPHYCVVPTLNINPADARLIAAAPDLLEALQQIKQRLDTCHLHVLNGHEVFDSFYMELIDNAIAKATGST